MGELSDARREEVWCILANFIDEERDHHYIELADIDIKQLEEIFFNEVALHCGAAYMSATPPIVEGFFDDEVVADLRKKRESRKKSVFSLLIQKSLSLFYHSMFKKKWETLVEGLEKRKQAVNL